MTMLRAGVLILGTLVFAAIGGLLVGSLFLIANGGEAGWPTPVGSAIGFFGVIAIIVWRAWAKAR